MKETDLEDKLHLSIKRTIKKLPLELDNNEQNEFGCDGYLDDQMGTFRQGDSLNWSNLYLCCQPAPSSIRHLDQIGFKWAWRPAISSNSYPDRCFPDTDKVFDPPMC